MYDLRLYTLPFPEKISRKAQAVHCPSDADASGYGQRYGNKQEANAGGIEGKQRQVIAGEQREDGGELQDGKRVATDKARKTCETGRHISVAPQQQAETEIGDGDPAQTATV